MCIHYVPRYVHSNCSFLPVIVMQHLGEAYRVIDLAHVASIDSHSLTLSDPVQNARDSQARVLSALSAIAKNSQT